MRLSVAVGCLLCGAAHATVPDSYGLGGRYLGMGGGGVAMVDDGPAALMNPAGLSRMRQPTVGLGVSAALERFDDVPPIWWDVNRDGLVDDRDPPLDLDVGVDDAVGAHFFMGRHVGGKFGLGIAGYLPLDRLLRFRTFEPDLPTYFMYDNRPQRYALAMGIGGEVVNGVNIGVSVDFVPRARLEVLMTADASITGDAETGEDLVAGAVIDVHTLSLDLVPGFAPIAGVQLELGKWVASLDGLVVGAMYRGEVGLPIEVVLDAQVDLEVTDVGDLDPFVTAIVAEAGLSLFDHYVPRTAALGVAWRRHGTLMGYADLRWTDWRRMVLSVARLSSVNVEAPLIDFPEESVTDGNDYSVTLRSVWSLRGGLEWELPRRELDNSWEYVQVTVRAGVGWEPSPLVSQGTSSAFLDADRLLLSAGAGLEMMDGLALTEAPWRVDLFGQVHLLSGGVLPRQADEPTAGYPREGAAIPIGGHVFLFGGQIAFDYN